MATSWWTSGSVSPPATSSSSSTRGPVARARASSRRLRSSRVRLPASRLASAVSPASSSASRLAPWASPSAPAPPKVAPTSTFSYTVIPGERLGDLEGAGQAELAAGPGRQAGDVLAAEADPPGVGPQLPRGQVEHGRLAGPVGPDHPQGLAVVQVHVQVVDDLERPERLRQPVQLQRPPGQARRPRRRGWVPGSRPWGCRGGPCWTRSPARTGTCRRSCATGRRPAGSWPRWAPGRRSRRSCRPRCPG